MSTTTISQAEKQIQEAKQTIKRERLREAKEGIKNAIKNNDDSGLTHWCIVFYALSKPIQRKPKATAQPNSSPV